MIKLLSCDMVFLKNNISNKIDIKIVRPGIVNYEGGFSQITLETLFKNSEKSKSQRVK